MGLADFCSVLCIAPRHDYSVTRGIPSGGCFRHPHLTYSVMNLRVSRLASGCYLRRVLTAPAARPRQRSRRGERPLCAASRNRSTRPANTKLRDIPSGGNVPHPCMRCAHLRHRVVNLRVSSEASGCCAQRLGNATRSDRGCHHGSPGRQYVAVQEFLSQTRQKRKLKQTPTGVGFGRGLIVRGVRCGGVYAKAYTCAFWSGWRETRKGHLIRMKGLLYWVETSDIVEVKARAGATR